MSKKIKQLARQLGDGWKLRRTLRQASTLNFVFSERIDFLNGQHWDRLAEPRGLLMSRDYWRALEQSGLADFEVRYAMAYRDGVPVAAAAMQLLAVSLETMHAHPGPRAEGSLRAALAQNIKPRLRQRLLVCGNMLSYGLDGVAFAAELDPQTRWQAVAEILYRIRRAEKLNGQIDFVLVKDLDPAALEDSRALGKLSYSMLETEPNMVLPLAEDWRVYEDYLAGMTSKYRSGIRQQIFKPIEAAGCEIGVMTPEQVDAQAERMQQLYLAVQDNATLRPVTVTADYWRRMAALGPERAELRGLWRDGALLGFLLVLKDGAEVTAAQIGFDRAAAKALPLYLRLLHTAIESALAAGGRRVIFGRTALEPKARMGCQPLPTTLWIRHRQPVLNSLIRNRFGIVHHDEAPAINPFKK